MSRFRFLTLFLGIVSFGAAARPALAEQCETKRGTAASTLLHCHNLDVLYLTGTPEARAREYGLLLKEKAIQPDLIDYFADRALLDLEAWPSFVHKLAAWIYERWAKSVFDSIAPNWTAEMKAMADGMGTNERYLERALLLPDLVSLLNGYAGEWPFNRLPPMGCTSVAKRAGTDDFFYGRNLDFGSVGIWDKHPLILVHLPQPGSSELRHIAFGAHGLFHAGITGVNEAGLVLAIHQNYADLRARGIPMPIVGEGLLREAKTLDEGVEFLRKNRPGPIWTFVLTDLKTGQSAAVETGANVFSVRRMDSTEFAQTNQLAGAETKPHEFVSKAFRANSKARFDLALRLLRSDPAVVFGRAGIFRVLAFQADGHGQINGYADVVKPLTIQTVVFETKTSQTPLNAKVNFSVSDAPTATGLFLTFRLGDLFNGPIPNPLTYDGQPAIAQESELRKNETAAGRAQHLYFDAHKYAEAIHEVEQQTSLGARLFLATASLENKDYEKAIAYARAAIADPSYRDAPALVRDSLHRPELLSLLALGRTAEAKQAATDALNAGTDDAVLLETARDIQDGTSLPLRLRKISYDFFTGNLRGAPERVHE